MTNTEYNLDHYFSLCHRLDNEKQRLENAKTTKEKELRYVWVSQLEKEIEKEIEFLESKGLTVKSDVDTMSDDELLKELEG